MLFNSVPKRKQRSPSPRARKTKKICFDNAQRSVRGLHLHQCKLQEQACSCVSVCNQHVTHMQHMEWKLYSFQALIIYNIYIHILMRTPPRNSSINKTPFSPITTDPSLAYKWINTSCRLGEGKQVILKRKKNSLQVKASSFFLCTSS